MFRRRRRRRRLLALDEPSPRAFFGFGAMSKRLSSRRDDDGDDARWTIQTAHAAMDPRIDDDDDDASLRTVSRPRSPPPGAVSETSLGVERARRLADARDAYDECDECDEYDAYDARARDDETRHRDHTPSPPDDSRALRVVPPPRAE
jgi:hypothetical protein